MTDTNINNVVDNPILFLDFDGVMVDRKGYGHPEYASRSNPWKAFTPMAVEQLNRILDEVEPTLIISSSWRLLYAIPTLEAFLRNAGIRRYKIHSYTPNEWTTNPCGDMRGYQILAALKALNFEGQYVILDDDSDMTDKQKAHHFVRTNEEVGLTKEDADKAIEILKRKVV